ncbi:MAG: acyltransferase family protein, partial [Lachnospiraceae bacterium]|nr:acyltransferase family protein [Lachnospiraceae bacterium]
MSDKRNIWIDIAKTVAIIGVVLQHLWGWAYDNEFVYNVILYAVPLFVLIGGYNLMDSYLRKGKVPIFKRILKMVLTYLIATLVYCIYGGQITDPGQIVERLMHFDACAPMYYVAVYLWLILVTPILVHVFDCEDQVKKALRAGAGLVIVTMVSYITTKLPDVLPVILGGGKILAGPWLLFHYSGMCIKAYEDKIRKMLSGYIPFAVNTVILILWQYLFIYRGINRGIPAVFGYSDILITWAGAAEVLLMFLWFIQAGWIIGDKRGLRAIAF